MASTHRMRAAVTGLTMESPPSPEVSETASTSPVAARVRARRKARVAQRFDEADALRLELLSIGVVVTDGKDEDTWVALGAQVSETHDLCMQWSHRKRQFCNQPRCTKEWFCQEHCAAGLRGRMPCPLDPRHNLKPAAMGSHLARCQKAPGRPAMATGDGGEPSADSGCNFGPDVSHRARYS